VARKPSALLTTTAPRGTEPSLPYAALLERAGYRVDQQLIPESGSISQLLSTLRLGPRVRRYDLIVANEYSSAIGLGLLAMFFRARARMVVLSLNLSRRAFKVGLPPVQRTIDRALGRYDAIVVHSSPEIASFVALHKLEKSRFKIIPWGFDLPAYEGAAIDGLPPRYVCVVGRNNRDFATVAAGLAGTGVTGVFVGADKSLERDEPDIRCFESLPFEDCLKIMAGALANVILVKDSTRGAGHITAVSGMLLGKPHIFSNVATLSEYLDNERDGIAVPLEDSAALNRAVLRLASDPALAARMGRGGRQHALREMSHARFMDRIVDVMLDRRSGTPT
jgi:glycosyltransferase involved in cell wall biosynthesis